MRDDDEEEEDGDPGKGGRERGKRDEYNQIKPRLTDDGCVFF